MSIDKGVLIVQIRLITAVACHSYCRRMLLPWVRIGVHNSARLHDEHDACISAQTTGGALDVAHSAPPVLIPPQPPRATPMTSKESACGTVISSLSLENYLEILAGLSGQHRPASESRTLASDATASAPSSSVPARTVQVLPISKLEEGFYKMSDMKQVQRIDTATCA